MKIFDLASWSAATVTVPPWATSEPPVQKCALVEVATVRPDVEEEEAAV